MYHSAFIHSPHLSCFQVSALTNKAAINIYRRSRAESPRRPLQQLMCEMTGTWTIVADERGLGRLQRQSFQSLLGNLT